MLCVQIPYSWCTQCEHNANTINSNKRTGLRIALPSLMLIAKTITPKHKLHCGVMLSTRCLLYWRYYLTIGELYNTK